MPLAAAEERRKKCLAAGLAAQRGSGQGFRAGAHETGGERPRGLLRTVVVGESSARAAIKRAHSLFFHRVLVCRLAAQKKLRKVHICDHPKGEQRDPEGLVERERAP